MAEDIGAAINGVRILARRLSLDTPGVRATVPMLRGVWGSALRKLDRQRYGAVFDGACSAPGYVLRPAPPDPEDAPAIDWILIGAATEHDTPLLAAWNLAAAAGLGRQRRPFFIRRIRFYRPDGTLVEQDNQRFAPWELDRAVRPLAPNTPCRIRFSAPLRLLRRGKLIASPRMPDLVLAIIRRLYAFMDCEARRHLDALHEPVLAVAKALPAEPWIGERLDLRRWSGTQKRELELRGVTGFLNLPEGLGPLAPLFAAGEWLHLGKATTVGLGQPSVEPLE